MNDFRTKLLQATRETAPTRGPWDDVLDDFVAVLNERYADALRAYLLGSVASGEVDLMVAPLGWRSQRTTLLTLAFDETGARTLGERKRTFTTPDAFQQYLIDLVRKPTFRRAVESMRKLATQPVTGVLHGNDLRARSPSTDILVTISPEEQRKLVDASDAKPRRRIDALHAALEGPSPAGQGTYAKGASLRWLVAGGYGLELDPEGGHEPDGERAVLLRGTPVDPTLLD